MFAAVTKGQDTPNPSIMPEELAGTITGTIANVDRVNQKALDDLNKALVDLMQSKEVPSDKSDE